MTTISTPHYLLDQARRRFVPTLNTLPGMGLLEKQLLKVDWKRKELAAPPAGGGLKPVIGDSGLPILGHIIEMYREGPEFCLHLYRKYGPVSFAESPILPSIVALGPDATQTVFSNKNKDYSTTGWIPVIGPFVNRGLMLLDFGEHLGHQRSLQGAFTPPRQAGRARDAARGATGAHR